MAKTFSVIIGSIFALLGLLGFTSNALIGTNALFIVDSAHNIIHIVLGLILLVVAFWFRKHSILWLKIVGSVTFLLGLIGILTVPSVGGTLFGIATTNGASNGLNLIAGAVIFIAGMCGREEAIA